MTERDFEDKDAQIDALILKANKLIEELEKTVMDMVMASAPNDAVEGNDEREQ